MMKCTIEELIAILSKYPSDAIVLTENTGGKATFKGIDHSETDFDVVKSYPWQPAKWDWIEKSHLSDKPEKATYICIR